MGTALIEQSVIAPATMRSCHVPGQPLLARKTIRAAQALLLAVLLNGAALAEVGMTVYLSEPNIALEPTDVNGTLVVYPEIMVGTKLAIVVDSNEGGIWYGGFFIEEPYRDYAVLSGRDYNDVTNNWEGSYYPEAGDHKVRVIGMSDIVRDEIDMYTHESAVPGEWFVIDYVASRPGPCSVNFFTYDHLAPGPPDPSDPPPPPEEILIHELAFYHVATRDFDGSGEVGLSDYALLADCWKQSAVDSSSPCSPADINGDTHVDIMDIAAFSDFWLEKTEY